MARQRTERCVFSANADPVDEHDGTNALTDESKVSPK
jgi:hypothetical protein